MSKLQPSLDLNVRVATLADLDEVAPLFDEYRCFYGQPPEPDRARQYVSERIERGESVVLVATATPADGHVVGFCQLYPTFCSVETTPIFVLYDLFVAPSARRQGVGHALLRAAERLASDQGKTRLDLRTARTNGPAQAVYESLDWVRDERFFCYSKYSVPAGPSS